MRARKGGTFKGEGLENRRLENFQRERRTRGTGGTYGLNSRRRGSITQEKEYPIEKEFLAVISTVV